MLVKGLGALAAAFLAVLLVAGSYNPAEARHGHSGWKGGSYAHIGRIYGGGARYYRSGHHRSFRRGVFIGAPLAYGAYYYGSGYYDGGCYWLRRRALATGSGYWWARYRDCLNGYDY